MEHDEILAARAEVKKDFDGSTDLFNACWVEYLRRLGNSIDNPTSIMDIEENIEALASEKVNNPKSKFYIHG